MGKPRQLNMNLDPETAEHLVRVAEASGMQPGPVARALLAQVLPGIERVQPVVRVVKRSDGDTRE